MSSRPGWLRGRPTLCWCRVGEDWATTGSCECNEITMKRLTKNTFLLLLLLLVGIVTMGFSLIGPPKNGGNPNDWQARGFGGRPAGLGYTLGGDIGGPMNQLEGYRWNVPIITYAFDESF